MKAPSLAAVAGRPVGGQSLAVVRIAFGLVALLSAVRLWAYGWIDTLYSGPERHFAYPGFGWVPALPTAAMRVLVLVIAVTAVLIALGLFYRIAIVVFWISFAWMEFIEASVYLNHYWFITVMGALMIVLPMADTWSLDARRRGTSGAENAMGASGATVAVGVIWLVRAQVAVVYVFAGLAKLHGDWLVRGLPMALWLPATSDLPIVGDLLIHASTARALSWAGAVFDCTVVVFLLWRRTRLWAWFAVVAFHLATWILFPIIGVFPWLMIAMSTIFFDPSWPGDLWRRVRARRSDAPASPSPADSTPVESETPATARTWRPVRTGALVAAAMWMLIQVVLPLRYLAYPGDHRWTGEAYRFGWNVLAVEKAGDVSFRVTDTTTGTTSRTDATDLYTSQQWRTMVNEPELIRQAAHAVAEQTRVDHPGHDVEVRADAYVSFNGREPARLIDPDVDLAAEPYRIGHQRWILPAPTSGPPEL